MKYLKDSEMVRIPDLVDQAENKKSSLGSDEIEKQPQDSKGTVSSDSSKAKLNVDYRAKINQMLYEDYSDDDE